MAIIMNNRKKKLLALVLSLTMVFSTVAGLASCKKESTSDDGSTTRPVTTETDTARIKNGNFEFFNDDDGKNLIMTSVTGWTKTNNNAATEQTFSSQTESGIIDTDEDSWRNLTQSSLDPSITITTKEQAATYWDQMSSYDKLSFYDTWASSSNKVEDLDFYDKEADDFNISLEDVPSCNNPLTHYTEVDPTKGKESSVLMLHNYNPSSRHGGTAQKYTSSTTVTLTAGTSAKVSLWAKTSDLVSPDGQPVVGNRGAYIGITHTVGGKTLDQMQIKNINTEAINPKPADNSTWTNNGWVQYEFYLKGCSYANSTFTMVLGLGQADGSQFEFVNGYAFFDDVTCTLLTNEEYATQTAAAGLTAAETVTIEDKGDEKLLRADAEASGKTKFALDLYSDFVKQDISAITTVGLTEEKKGGTTYVATTKSGCTVYNPLKDKISADNDVAQVFDSLDALEAEANSKNHAALKKILSNDFKAETFDTLFTNNTTVSDDILMMLSMDGANYTATLEDDTTFNLDGGEKMIVSFFLKTSSLSCKDKVNLTLVNKSLTNKDTTLNNLDVSSIQTVDVEDNEDIYDGWQQCFFFVKNESEANLKFSLKITLGSQTIIGTTESDYASGYAAITGFQLRKDMTNTEYDCISVGTYAANALLYDQDEDDADKNLFDSAATLPIDQIEKGIALPANYQGVYGGSGLVSSTSTDVTVNENAYAGLINKNYASAYASSDWATELGWDEADIKNELGNFTQPLFFYNKKNADADTVADSYGFIGNATILNASSSTPTVLSYNVKATAGAKVTIALTDMDDYTRESSLSVSRKLTYWYDDDGNVCAVDPSSKNFKASTDVAFRLQSNGLYKVNTKWAQKAGVSIDKNAFFANLQNYDKDSQGNLVLADDAVSYQYTDSWRKDGIAFYQKNGKYYADKAKTVEVNQLPLDIARYTASNSYDLSITVTGTGEWQKVSFYLVNGSKNKNYRVEIWNGDRQNKANGNPEGSYVLVAKDSITGITDKTGFTDRIDEYAALLAEKHASYEEGKDFTPTGETDALFYATYSFYDSNRYLRYDETLDENKVGNSYDDYTQSTYSEGVAYLRAAGLDLGDGIKGDVLFVDYSLLEQAPAVDTDSTEDEDTADEEDDDEDELNVWLLISSLSIAVVLLIAVVALVVRKATAKARKNKAQAATAAPKAKTVKNRRYNKK